MSDAAAIAFDNVHFAYQKNWVLEQATFQVEPRETACIVGPNGGGKSTLLRLVLGLLEPARGSIRVLGKKPARARTRIGYMPQQIQFDPRFPITVEEIVRMGRLQGNAPRFRWRSDRAQIEAVLDEVGLRDAIGASFSELSGGQKQRVLIARAMAVEPDLLLLDEPTAMVDSHIEAQLLQKLKDLHKRLTIVLVSHDAAFVSELVSSVICVNRHVAVHPTGAVPGGAIHELYGERVRAVKHEHELEGPPPVVYDKVSPQTKDPHGKGGVTHG